MLRAVAGVPLTSAGRVVGVIGLAHLHEDAAFSERDIAQLDGFAQFASLAIEHARLHEAAQRELAERRRAEEQVRRLNAALEARVQERTRELEEAHRARGALLEVEQAARAQAEAALRVREDFLVAISHDLRTPLTAIQGMVQIVQRRAARGLAITPDLLTEALDTIGVASTRMNDLICQVLDLARVQGGELVELMPVPTDLVALVQREAAALARVSPLHTVAVESDEAVLIGRWDRQRLEGVIANLLSNAAKFSPLGGVVRVQISRTAADGCVWAEVRIADQGLGIPVDELPRVFERFYRATNASSIPGTGIGLAAAAQAVAQHGGQIALESTLRAGTTVTVCLPIDSRSRPPRA